MTMTKRDALNVLGIALEDITPEITKQAYRKAAQQYHPDRNPAGTEMMQLVNAAYQVLKDFTGKVLLESSDSCNYGQKINEALNAIIGLGLKIEICGTWIWVSGDTKVHKEKLKAAKYIWANKKKCWYFRAEGYKSRNHKSWSMEKIQEVYGSKLVQDEQQKIARCA
ncbi:MAG TPA: DnaJ domain-containing protein [Gammaproteobacteria bacterium]|nr:DnaJ domain-containing protein [Gammaproteobacteria bacterium]